MQYCGCRGGCAVTTYSAVERLVLERGRELAIGWLHTYSTAGGLGAGEDGRTWWWRGGYGVARYNTVRGPGAREDGRTWWWRGGYGVAKYSTVTREGAMGWLSTVL